MKTLEKMRLGKKKFGLPYKKNPRDFNFFYIEVETDAIAEMRILFGYEDSILKNIFFVTSDWQKEVAFLKQTTKEPNLNVEKLIKIVNEE